jgi:hypothetical protein
MSLDESFDQVAHQLDEEVEEEVEADNLIVLDSGVDNIDELDDEDPQCVSGEDHLQIIRVNGI